MGITNSIKKQITSNYTNTMVNAAGRREQIKAELLAQAEQLLAGFDTYDTVEEDASKNYIAKQFVGQDGNNITLIRYRADGLTEEQLEQWRQDPTAVQAAMNSKMTRVILPEDEGQKVVLIKMKMPMVISNRSIVTCYYEDQKEDGTRILLNSSRGNEQIQAANADKIGKDVVASIGINYLSTKAYDGGIELIQINHSDPNGSIPGFMKSKMAKNAAKGLLNLVAYLQTGAKPSDN